MLASAGVAAVAGTNLCEGLQGAAPGQLHPGGSAAMEGRYPGGPFLAEYNPASPFNAPFTPVHPAPDATMPLSPEFARASVLGSQRVVLPATCRNCMQDGHVCSANVFKMQKKANQN